VLIFGFPRPSKGHFENAGIAKLLVYGYFVFACGRKNIEFWSLGGDVGAHFLSFLGPAGVTLGMLGLPNCMSTATSFWHVAVNGEFWSLDRAVGAHFGSPGPSRSVLLGQVVASKRFLK
jgi:hypothetical protein